NALSRNTRTVSRWRAAVSESTASSRRTSWTGPLRVVEHRERRAAGHLVHGGQLPVLLREHDDSGDGALRPRQYADAHSPGHQAESSDPSPAPGLRRRRDATGLLTRPVAPVAESRSAAGLSADGRPPRSHSPVSGGSPSNGRRSGHPWTGSPPAPGAADNSPAISTARS